MNFTSTQKILDLHTKLDIQNKRNRGKKCWAQENSWGSDSGSGGYRM